MASQPEFWLDRVTLNPDFFGLLQHIENLAGLRLDVLIGMTSDAAQSIYTYLPSRAVHRSSANPFEITLTTLMEQIGLNVPPHKSKRHQIFTQRSPSIVNQLNGAETLTGILRGAGRDGRWERLQIAVVGGSQPAGTLSAIR